MAMSNRGQRVVGVKQWRTENPRQFIVEALVRMVHRGPTPENILVSRVLNKQMRYLVPGMVSVGIDRSYIESPEVVRAWINGRRPELLEMFDAAMTIVSMRRP